ncbi:MAG: hypothetical protein J1E84_03545 [Muribaculaceae bacterium]|nr:hypothetical protein [Muribaculaceae bacterium]
MKNILNRLVVIILSVIFVACSSPDPAAEIDAADNALIGGDSNLAREICNSLLDNNSNLTASQLAHISLIYMQLADMTDDTDIIDRAARCWRDAMTANTDSAMAYYQSVPIEQQKNVILLAAIVHTFDRAANIPGIEWTTDDSSAFDLIPFDSIPEFPDEYHHHDYE